MKKKVKLITTIASLCLAVALMAFGVYAATNATLNVTSTVAFQSSTVLIDVTGSVAGYATIEDDAKASYTHTADPTSTAKYEDTWDIGAMTFSEEKKEITYSVTITNKSEFAITVTLHTAPTTTATLKYEETGRSDFANIAAKTGTATYTLTVTLLKFDATVSPTPVNLSFNAVAAE